MLRRNRSRRGEIEVARSRIGSRRGRRAGRGGESNTSCAVAVWEIGVGKVVSIDRGVGPMSGGQRAVKDWIPPVLECIIPVICIPVRLKEDVEIVSGKIGGGATLKTTNNSREFLIHDVMELRRDPTGEKIPDETDCRGMVRGETEELAAARAWFPFGNFLAILKTRVKNVSRGAEDFGATKILATGRGPTEELNRSGLFALGSMIVNPSGVVHCEWPKIVIVFFGPVDLDVKEHSTCHASDGADRAFRFPVLMVSVDGGG